MHAGRETCNCARTRIGDAGEGIARVQYAEQRSTPSAGSARGRSSRGAGITGRKDRGKERKEDREVVSGDRAGAGFLEWGRMAQVRKGARVVSWKWSHTRGMWRRRRVVERATR